MAENFARSLMSIHLRREWTPLRPLQSTPRDLMYAAWRPWSTPSGGQTQVAPPRPHTLFAWLISHQPTVLFSQNKPATNNQPAVLFSQNKPAPAISHQPNERSQSRPGGRRPCSFLMLLMQQAVLVVGRGPALGRLEGVRARRHRWIESERP
jgi:hypothetical protein